MTRLTLHWHLREIVGPRRGGSIEANALSADDPVAFLDTVRNHAWRPVEERNRAADLLTKHLWPDDDGAQRPTWHAEYLDKAYEIEAQKRLGRYSVPRDDEGELLEGYHAGGLWFHEIPRAEPLACPDCSFSGEFWDFEPVDTGEDIEPHHHCPNCGWVPPDAEVTA